MIESCEYGLIGVDGGGSSCRFALLWRGQRTEVTLGRANVATDRSGAISTIEAGLEALADKAGMPLSQLQSCPAYLGLAGAVDRAAAEAVAAAVSLKRVMVEDDRSAAVVGALAGGPGTVAGIGTGSFLARNSDAGLRLVGGWGFQIGDEASGAWLGKQLLNMVLQSVDGLRDWTGLTENTYADFDGSAGTLVHFSLSATPADFARFAPAIVRAAGAGDAVAVTLMQRGAGYVSETVRALGWTPPEPLCLVGGVAPHYQGYLPADMAQSVTPAKESALEGALRLAAKFARRDMQVAG